MKSVWLIARTVLLEAVRRKEIYAIVAISLALIGAALGVNVFELDGLTKFYREIALKAMSLSTALMVIVLAARQLPREFEARTIYPLLAKPVSRFGFLCGKLLGVMLAAGFCFALFMGVYLAGSLFSGAPVPWALFAQYVYLQMLLMLVLATLGFWLSMAMTLDAAIVMGVVFFGASATLTAAMAYLYDDLPKIGQKALLVLNFAIPHLTLFDLSEKAVHSDMWGPVGWKPMAVLTLYAGVFSLLYFAFAMFCFRRRPL